MTLPFRPETFPALAKYGTAVSDLPSSPEDAQRVATAWIQDFATALASGSADAVLALFIPDFPIWRDLLVLSWDFRTLIGPEAISAFLVKHLVKDVFFKFLPAATPAGVMPLGEVAGWINAFASFETAERQGTAVLHLVPTRKEGASEVDWKAQGILMDLDGLTGHPALEGEHRKQEPILGGWEEAIEKESQFEDKDPQVVVIGGSQCGLAIAARLKAQGVPALVLERTARLGDMWRGRYDTLCLHDPVHSNHMPYLPFPSTWPVYIPGRKLANFLESYAEILELAVWRSANATKVYRTDNGAGWNVDVDVGDTMRTLKTNHVIFAIGYGSGRPSIPSITGIDTFAGESLHSSAHKTAADHRGKKVAVIGSSTSAHDVCYDLAQHAADVTMVQRGPTYVISPAGMRQLLAAYSEGGPPTDVADRLTASMPVPFVLPLAIGMTQAAEAADKELLDGLRGRGFKLWKGKLGAGLFELAYSKGGGYYPNHGASELIVDGSIKLRSDSIERIDKDGLVFADGSLLPADVIVWATGFEDPTAGVRRLIASKDVEGMKPVWGVDEEGEWKSFWRHTGVDGLHVMGLNLSLARYYSKHLALRIKAIELGICNA